MRTAVAESSSSVTSAHSGERPDAALLARLRRLVFSLFLYHNLPVLTHMPKLTPSEWLDLDPIAKWLIACRASVLFMTFTASALGGLMAWRAGAFEPGLWLATVLGLGPTTVLFGKHTDKLEFDQAKCGPFGSPRRHSATPGTLLPCFSLE